MEKQVTLELNFDSSKELVEILKNEYNTQIFFVGGCVRDYFLNKESKDIDLVVPHINIFELKELLSKFGIVNLVGESFGILKFKPFSSEIEYDVAVPRKERSIGDSHIDFEVDTDISITLEEDLSRRDFTINALAVSSLTNEVVDIFGGLDDLYNKIIKIISEESFKDDPLRMLRALQFSARFDFKLSHETETSLDENKENLKYISKERIRIEFLKAIKKIDTRNIFLGLLLETGIDKVIFDREINFPNSEIFDMNQGILNLGEFLFVSGLCTNNHEILSKIELVKEDKKTIDVLSALTLLEDSDSLVKDIFDIGLKNPFIYELKSVKGKIKDVIEKFNNNFYPKTYKEIPINGKDIMERGFKGEEISYLYGHIVNMIIYRVDMMGDDFKTFTKKDIIELIS